VVERDPARLRPHFHVRGPDTNVKVRIETLQVMRGQFTGAAFAEAITWAADNLPLLREKWSEFNERD
jgi:Domain of unknown function (DUF4160)